MKLKPLNRRTVLRGMLATGAGVAIPLPLLDGMLNANGTALAAGSAISPLYVTWFFGNGSLPGRWKPAQTGAGTEWSLSPQLEPLSAVKSHLTVISGLENKLVISGLEHPSGSAGCTTGASLGGDAVRSKSIDQIVADHISEDTDYRSIEVGVTPATPNGNQHSLHSVSHNGANATLRPEYDPAKIFQRLFMAGMPEAPTEDGGDDQAAKLATVRKSVLDAVLDDGTALGQKLGSLDKERVEQHMDAIRAIELRIDAMSTAETPAVECGTATAPTTGPDTQSEAPPEVNTAMVELSTLALACDKTRVLSFMFSLPAAHVYYRHLAPDMNDDFHDTICHTDEGDESNQPRVDTGVLYAMRCLNEFLTSFQNTPYGAATLLDASLIYVTSDTAWGKIHTKEEWPVLLAGKAGGKLRGDEHFNFQSESLSRALLTAAQLMNPDLQSFGLDDGMATSTLPGIIV